jgi:hypothetical protein
LAPYSIVLSDDRVTEEDAPIGLLQPHHPLFTSPNRITQADFENWIQERGLYFPKEWDSHYTALLTTSDKGEAPLRGGLLVAPYGKGNYIYTSMVWYRQLRAGIPRRVSFLRQFNQLRERKAGNQAIRYKHAVAWNRKNLEQVRKGGLPSLEVRISETAG